MNKLHTYLLLMRPANIMTAFADILAGFGVAAIPLLMITSHHFLFYFINLLLLLITTAGLYGGGVVFNDVCDAELDKIERPERPIPQGRTTKREALLLAILLWVIGLSAAFLVSLFIGWIALCILFLSITYDIYTKSIWWLCAPNIALCRALNLLMGLSIVPEMLSAHWALMVIPFLFVMGVSLISQEEVYAKNKLKLMAALILYLLTIAILLLLNLSTFSYFSSLPFLIIFSLAILLPLLKAMRHHTAVNIRNAVKISILSIILLDSAIAAIYADAYFAVVILLLLPVSIFFAKKFAVT